MTNMKKITKKTKKKKYYFRKKMEIIDFYNICIQFVCVSKQQHVRVLTRVVRRAWQRSSERAVRCFRSIWSRCIRSTRAKGGRGQRDIASLRYLCSCETETNGTREREEGGGEIRWKKWEK